MTDLTPRQLEFLTFIRDHQDREGRPPTIREIAENFGIRSPNAVMGHIASLKKKGYLLPSAKGRACSLRLNPEKVPTRLQVAEAALERLAEMAGSEAWNDVVAELERYLLGRAVA